MKIAIFHDYFGAIGGGEKTTVNLAEALQAKIFTTDFDILPSFAQNIPIVELKSTIKFPPLKQISASRIFASAQLQEDFDFYIFTGNWSHYAARIHRPNLWYCYTPVRAFYDLYSTFKFRQNAIVRPIFRSWVACHRRYDQKSIKNVEQVISISNNVKKRIKEFYNIDADIISPPIKTSEYSNKGFENFWLSVNRLYPEKRLEIQLDAFRMMPDENLVICGGYSKGDHASRYVKRILRDLPKNVTYLGVVDEKELISLYSKCSGLISTSLNEDFGLTPIEAMASGKPVIATNEGGYTETITKDTGILISPDKKSLCDAIFLLSDNPESYSDACMRRAQLYDFQIFKNKFKTIIERRFS